MASFKLNLAAVATLFTSSALAGFDPSSQANVAVYWGQNSAGTATSQARLGEYCDNDEIDIIPIGFMNGISPQILNFASATDQCTPVDGTQTFICPEIEEDIKACQAKGKTILMSLGGMTYSQGGFSDATAAQQAADQVWDLFGTNTAAANRPFGSAVVDGFDFDFEASTQNFAPFANQLRSHMDASGKTMYLSAAPQCVYPDAAMNDMLNGAVSFDFIMIQFYNNWCGVTNFQPDAAEDPYNFDVWDTWAKQTSKNPSVKVLMGVPASADAGGGYIAAAQLDPVIQYNKQFSSFGGAMMWDMSQLYTNSGFLDTVYASLNDGSAPAEPAPTSTTTTATATTTTTTTGPSPTEPSPTGAVPHWGQCGGDGYTGPTDCEAPYTCQGNEWWMSCQ